MKKYLMLILLVFLFISSDASPILYKHYLPDLYAKYYGDKKDYFIGMDTNKIVQKMYRPRALNFYAQITGNGRIAFSIIDWALSYKIPINLCFALAKVESQFNPLAVGYNSDRSIDYGTLQLNSYSFKLPRHVLLDIDTNVKLGLGYFQYCYETCSTPDLAIVGYNMGVTQALKGFIPEMRKSYVASILEYEKYLDRLFNEYDWR
jgi:soluble lytic murein transglycosylase-like protein